MYKIITAALFAPVKKMEPTKRFMNKHNALYIYALLLNCAPETLDFMNKCHHNKNKNVKKDSLTKQPSYRPITGYYTLWKIHDTQPLASIWRIFKNTILSTRSRKKHMIPIM